jgi:hypothetical protein
MRIRNSDGCSYATRRELLKLAAAGVSGFSLSGWLGTLAASAAQEKKKGKSCILLWMDGGPSHVDTFDPKPEAPDFIRGDLKAIPTSVPGIQVGERFPRLAQLMHHAALLRSMSTVEADHGRARIAMHTGFRPGAGGISYPGLGSTVAAEIGNPESPLPNFVITGSPLNKYDVLRDPGFRGPRCQPLVLEDLSRGLENVRPAVADEAFDRRVTLLEQVEARFAQAVRAPATEAHQAGLDSALKLMRSGQSEAFDLSVEPRAVRDAYGDHDFGRGCLLARRLVEAGVAFVEVYLSNWDSHERKVAEGTRDLMTQVDMGASALVNDLRSRGLLDNTLIIWMGEFGRTPRLNQVGGRDHYAKAWTTVLVGGGIRGGRVVANDFMATLCRILGIDFKKQVMTPSGRPIRIVEKGERLIDELIS